MRPEWKVFAVSMVMAAACGGTDTKGNTAGPSSGNSAATTGNTAGGTGTTGSTTGTGADAAGGNNGGGSGAVATGGPMSTGGSGRSRQPDAGAKIDGTGGAEADASDDGGGMVGRGEAGSRCGDSNDAGGSACEQALAVDRSCMADTDCVAVNHQTDYMGQVRLLGIRSSEMAHFATLEKLCHAMLPSFNLPAITADDGSLVDGSARAVTCQAGICTTFSPACGHACPCGHVCITCGNGVTATSVCSQLCSMGACTEAPRTSCLGGASLNGGEGEFCFDPVFAGGFMSTSCHR